MTTKQQSTIKAIQNITALELEGNTQAIYTYLNTINTMQDRYELAMIMCATGATVNLVIFIIGLVQLVIK